MKKRADILAFEQGLFKSREQAQGYIMAGLVYSPNELIDKPGRLLDEHVILKVKKMLIPYVSRGGVKLEEGLRNFKISAEQKVAMDIGSSTGGFVDCLLQHGAKLVYSVDVTNHLDNKLKNDSRVVVFENTNFRYFEKDLLKHGLPELITIDVSFISLKIIFATLKNILPEKYQIIALVKPQFEAGREQVGKKGVVKDGEVLKEVIKKVIGYGRDNGMMINSVTHSPIKGKKEGNIEFLAYFSHDDEQEIAIEKIVENAYNYFKEKGKDQC